MFNRCQYYISHACFYVHLSYPDYILRIRILLDEVHKVKSNATAVRSTATESRGPPSFHFWPLLCLFCHFFRIPTEDSSQGPPTPPPRTKILKRSAPLHVGGYLYCDVPDHNSDPSTPPPRSLRGETLDHSLVHFFFNVRGPPFGKSDGGESGLFVECTASSFR